VKTGEHLNHLFAYNDWANRRLIEALSENNCGRAQQLLAHLLITQQEYFERLTGKDSTGFNFFPDLSIEECRELSAKTSEQFVGLLGTGEEALERIASYKTSEGVPYQNTWRELLTHVLFHSSIHRGNIMLKLRESGIAPPAIDYIIYLREEQAAIR
jgi:uncharacterized damage-inducible protein DinB